MNGEIILKLVEVGVLIITAIVGRYLVPFLREKVNFTYMTEAVSWAETFVKAAEMMVKGEKMGEEKLNMVTEMMREKLNELGITFTEEQIRALIEEAVKNLQNQ